ncbi:MAG: hypothetical protein ACRCYU_01275, partial [Nocardioides sp.]
DAADQYDSYAAAHIKPSPQAQELGAALLGVLRKRGPRPLRPVLVRAVSALIEPQSAVTALGLPPVGPITQATVNAMVTARRRLTSRPAPPTKPSFHSGQPAGSIYPDGYTIEDLVGPDHPEE